MLCSARLQKKKASGLFLPAFGSCWSCLQRESVSGLMRLVREPSDLRSFLMSPFLTYGNTHTRTQHTPSQSCPTQASALYPAYITGGAYVQSCRVCTHAHTHNRTRILFGMRERDSSVGLGFFFSGLGSCLALRNRAFERALALMCKMSWTELKMRKEKERQMAH